METGTGQHQIRNEPLRGDSAVLVRPDGRSRPNLYIGLRKKISQIDFSLFSKYFYKHFSVLLSLFTTVFLSFDCQEERCNVHFIYCTFFNEKLLVYIRTHISDFTFAFTFFCKEILLFWIFFIVIQCQRIQGCQRTT